MHMMSGTIVCTFVLNLFLACCVYGAKMISAVVTTSGCFCDL